MSEADSGNRKPLLIGLSVVLLAIAGAVMWMSTRTGGAQAVASGLWFYDVGKKERFKAGLDDIPPIAAPSGAKTSDGEPGGVRLHVYACGDCASEQFNGYLERYTSEVKAKRIEASQKYGSRPESLSPAAMRQSGLKEHDGHLVASAEAPDQWHPADSPEGAAIIAAASVKCGSGKPLSECWPK